MSHVFPLLFRIMDAALLATVPDTPAGRAGYILPASSSAIVSVLAIVMFGIVSIIMAFVKRTTGWIVMGSISGFFVLILGSLTIFGFVAGFAKGFTKGYTDARARSALSAGASRNADRQGRAFYH